MLDILFGLFGLASLLGIAWAFSDNKRKVDWKLVGTGVLLQLGFRLDRPTHPVGRKGV
jgi:CNT family concentrative nucleoside transporter